MACNQSNLTRCATLLLCLAACVMLPGAKATGRALAAAKQAPTGCITVISKCTRDDLDLALAYKDTTTNEWRFEGFWTVTKGGSRGPLCFTNMDRRYGFYVHFSPKNVQPEIKSVITLNAATNTPDPDGDKAIGGCALLTPHTLAYLSGSGASARYKDVEKNRQGTCAALGGKLVDLDHLTMDAQNRLTISNC